MMTQLSTIWKRLRSTYWFVPLMMALGAIILANVMIEFDQWADPEFVERIPLLYRNSPAGERAVLSTIAGSMITVAGVTFSIVIVVLVLASQQSGPRLVGNFLRDRGTQVVLGIFISTFIYCLLVLRSIRDVEDSSFAPSLSALVGVLLAMASLGMLIYFIDHMSASIQVSNIIHRVNNELQDSISKIFPEHLGEHPHDDPSEHVPSEVLTLPHTSLTARNDGYLQFIDSDHLLKTATDFQAALRLRVQPGHFVVSGDAIIDVWSRQAITQDFEDEVHQALVFGNQRTVWQDTEFSMQQLVEMAVRALSPGVNDPVTAQMCLDRLEAALCQLAKRSMPDPYRYDDQHELRVIAPQVTFAYFLHIAFDQIRRYGGGDVTIVVAMLRALQNIAHRVQREQDWQALRTYADLIQQSIKPDLPDPDRALMMKVYQATVDDLEGHPRYQPTTQPR